MRPIRVMLAFLLLLIPSSVASADISQFSGKWKNVDTTGALTTLLIEVKGTRVGIRAWGRCRPSDCEWGYATGTAYASSVQSNLRETAQAISTIYINSFSQKLLIIRPAGDGQIEVEMFTKFTDQSGRANYTRVERLSRVGVEDVKR